MDPETAKALAPVLAALVGGAIGWGGAWITGSTQVRIARETAMRSWRLERVKPLLEKSYEMYGRFVEVGAEARSAAPEVAVQKALEALGDATVAPLGHIGIADQQFATAFNHVRVATERCLELALALGKEPRSEDRRQALDLAIDEMNNAIGQLTNAAERYLRDAR
jgi:hypothetical protein